MLSRLPTNSVQAVLFDYGMVLTAGPYPPAWQKMQAITGFDEATFHAAYWDYRRGYDRGDLSGRQYWQAVAGRAISGDAIDALIAADTSLWTQPNQPMIDWAMALQRAGMRTGILSNLGDAMTEGVLGTFPWLAGFYHRTWSHTLNVAKPEPGIYTHAAAGLDTPAPHILFVDDREDNIAAAAEAGMQTILYSDHAAFERQMRRLGYGELLAPQPVMA